MWLPKRRVGDVTLVICNNGSHAQALWENQIIIFAITVSCQLISQHFHRPFSRVTSPTFFYFVSSFIRYLSSGWFLSRRETLHQWGLQFHARLIISRRCRTLRTSLGFIRARISRLKHFCASDHVLPAPTAPRLYAKFCDCLTQMIRKTCTEYRR